MSQDVYLGTWEVFSTDSNITILRLRVPGGWLVTIRDTGVAVEYSTTVFIQNPNYNWVLET